MSRLKIKAILVLAVVFYALLITFLFASIASSALLFREAHVEDGVLVYRIRDKPAQGILKEGEAIHRINDRDIIKLSDLMRYLNELKPGDRIVIKTNVSEYALILAAKPYEKDKTYLGVLLTQNYKEQDISLLKEVLFKALPVLVMTFITAIIIFSIVFQGLANTLTALIAPEILRQVYIYYSSRITATAFVLPGLKTPVDKVKLILWLVVLLLIIAIVFIVPAKWIKKEDKDYFKKILRIYVVLILVSAFSLVIGQVFNFERFTLADVILLPLSFSFFALWATILRRIFERQNKQNKLSVSQEGKNIKPF